MVIRDRLSSAVARNYEFNMHAPIAFAVEDNRNVKVAINGQSVCIRSLGAGGTWEKRIGAAPKPGTIEDHGAFVLPAGAGVQAEFLVVFDVGCKRPAMNVVANGTGVGATRTVTVGSQSITLN